MELKRIMVKGLKELDDAGKGQAVFATLNVIDRDRDVTLPGAFGEQLCKWLPAHDWGHVPLGKARIHEQGDDAIADFQLNLGIAAARDWQAALKFDLADGQPIQEWSYGFDVLEASNGEFQGQRVRFLKKLRVHEISPVVIGAGVNTRTLGMKGRKLADQIEDVRAEITDLVERVSGLKDLRAEEGRELPKERREQLERLQADLKALSEISEIVGGLAATGANDTAAGRKLYSEFVALQARIGRRPASI